MQTDHAPDYTQEWQYIDITKKSDQEIDKIIIVPELVIKYGCQKQI
jgi:hypothetical protein